MSWKAGHGLPARIGRLDGLRAVAIVLVFLLHEGIGRFGWEGVPLFFALSGFLITTILRRSRAEESFWGPFYIKRATRILPPLVIAFVAAFLFTQVAWRKVGLYELLFAANIAEVIHPRQSGSLSVLWSLAVEEQFYLLWPFAIRYLDRKRLMQVLVIVLIAGPVLRGIMTPRFSSIWPIFYLTPFQLDGLAGGSLLALIVESDSATKVLRKWAGALCGLLAISFILLSLTHGFNRDANNILFNSLGYSMVYLVSATLIAYVLLCPSSLVSSFLGSRLMVFLGSVSYGFYLFHPVGITLVDRLGAAVHYSHNRVLAPFAFAAVVGFSWLSFRYYEQPVISWGKQAAGSLQASKKQLATAAQQTHSLI
jgi:peptidoglycan/LPS O-acetylase OafA/YrhL